jgi:hypothetical protein
MAYLGNDLSTIVKSGKIAYKFLATSGQTSFSGNDANGVSLELTTDSFVNVFLNGVRLIRGDDYTLSTNTLTLVTGATLNDELVIVRDIDNSVYTSYTKTETDTLIQTAKDYADIKVSTLVDSAPGALDTLNELAAALGDDANFASTVTTSLSNKANLTDLIPSNISDKNNTSTGYFDLPVGSTAQRPSPSAGMMRYNSTGKWMEYYDGQEWVQMVFGAAITNWSNSSYSLDAGSTWRNMATQSCPDFGNRPKVLSISFDGYISSGTYYWTWRLSNARTGSVLPSLGGYHSYKSYVSSGGGIQYRGNVHAMSAQPARAFDASDCLTGDTIRLELSASNGEGDVVYTNGSQTLYVDNIVWWVGALSGKEMDTYWNA